MTKLAKLGGRGAWAMPLWGTASADLAHGEGLPERRGPGLPIFGAVRTPRPPPHPGPYPEPLRAPSLPFTRANGVQGKPSAPARTDGPIEVQYRFSVSAGTVLLIFTPHTAHRVKNFHAMRLGAVLSVLYVAVGPSKIMRVDAAVLFAKLGGATGPYLSTHTQINK